MRGAMVFLFVPAWLGASPAGADSRCPSVNEKSVGPYDRARAIAKADAARGYAQAKGNKIATAEDTKRYYANHPDPRRFHGVCSWTPVRRNDPVSVHLRQGFGGHSYA